MAGQFKYLFTPLKIGNVTVPNRIFQAPHGKAYGQHVNDRFYIMGEREAYYVAERARGGAGLVTVGTMAVHITAGGGKILASPKEVIPRFKLTADLVHRYPSKVFVQLYHPGMLHYDHLADEPHELWSPSFIPGLSHYGNTKAMELEDIQALVKGFAQSASNAREGGLDGVEIHAAHGYLLNAFLSPATNRRTDDYGGSLDNRMRIVLETIDAVRKAVGGDYVVGIRISGDEFAPGALTLDDMKVIAARLEATGKLNYISVSAGGQLSAEAAMAISATHLAPPGFLVYLAAGIKSAVKSLPVFATNRINDPALAEKILAEGQADMVSMTRALLCDPELPLKTKEGRQDDIRHCVGCLQGCLSRIFERAPMTCIQNPSVGREQKLGIGTLKPAAQKKKVMVIGGGPAGLKAAEIAARRGHDVTIFEKDKELGGQNRLAHKTPLEEEFGEISRYLISQVQKLGVKVKLGQEATEATVRSEKPDAVVVATGCLPMMTQFVHKRFADEKVSGIDQDNVVSVFDVLDDKVKVGKHVVLVDGEGHYRNLTVADLLAGKGSTVDLVTPNRSLMSSRINTVDNIFVPRRLREKGVTFITGAQVKSISGNKVTILIGKSEKVIEGVDTVVWATGMRPNDALYFSLKGKVKELYRAGDCVSPRFMENAIWEGENIGRTL